MPALDTGEHNLTENARNTGPRLTEQERQEVIRFIDADKPLPDKYRFLPFEDKREAELVWNGKTAEICNIVWAFWRYDGERGDVGISTSAVKETMMQKNMRISMYEVVGGPFCVASDDGQKIYDRLAAALAADRGVALSFHNVTALTSAFLDVAIGQLYGTFGENQIRSLLMVEDAKLEDLALVERVVANAKRYFADPQRFEQAYREVMGEDDDEP